MTFRDLLRNGMLPFMVAFYALVSPLSTIAQSNIEVFGQNRVQYRKFDWKYFDTKHFRVYHYDKSGRQLGWTGVHAGDGPREFHLVLLDNGRSKILADEVARATLHCIRCSRCLNVCPVYERAGGHAYDSMYQGPIGAIVTPQLRGLEEAGSLPYASSLCGACHEVCPVKINIPQILVHLRGRVVREGHAGTGEALAMEVAARMFGNQGALDWSLWAGRLGQKLLMRDGALPWLPPPLSGWTLSRDFPALPQESFRDWWQKREER